MIATFFGTFITVNRQLTHVGVMPQTFIAVKAGLTLQGLNSLSEVIDVKVILTFFALGFLSILPTLSPVKTRLDKLLNRKVD
jgi:hypothetical protein